MQQRLVLRRVIVSVIGALAILWLGSSLKDFLGSRPSPVRQMSFRESSKAVQAEPVVLKSREIFLSNMGKVISESAVDIITEVQGAIQPGRVSLKRGQSFAAGQVLFRIDDEEARLTLYAQKSNFMTAVASVLPELKIDYPNTFSTWQTYFESLSVEENLPKLPEIKSSQEKVFFSTRDILNQYYSIKSAEERLDKYVVRAPFSGSYIEVLQEVGSVVNNGTRVARIARSNRLEIELPIRAEDLSYVRKGMKVKISATDGSQTWEGSVRRVGSIVDPTTQSVNVYIQFNPRKDQVFDGQLLLVEIPGSRVLDVMEIPRNAVFNKDQVFVIEDSRLKSQQIKIEKLTQDNLLFSGLEEGVMVVTEPLINAYDNMEVSIKGVPDTDEVVETPVAEPNPSEGNPPTSSSEDDPAKPTSSTSKGAADTPSGR